MHTTITRPSILPALNSVLQGNGLVADCVMVLPNEEINFSRVSASPETLKRSYDLVTHALGASGIALPRAYKVEGDDVVGYASGAGYTGDATNTNPSGMGLVLRARHLSHQFALGTTFADAPAMSLIHPPSGLIASVSGIGHVLGRGTVSQTINLLKRQATALGFPFKEHELWGMQSPAARHGYLIDDNMIKIKLAGVPKHLLDETIKEVQGQDRPYSLDLALLFKRLWETAGVPAGQIDFDERNTLTERDSSGRLVLPSKRAKDERGEQYSSGILAVVVKSLA